MKTKDLTNLRAKDKDEILKMVANRKVELIKVSAEIKTSKEKNLKKVKNLRRDLSQILTIAREKEIIEEEGLRDKKL